VPETAGVVAAFDDAAEVVDPVEERGGRRDVAEDLESLGED
jgi:hypothetical protein